MRQLSTAAAAMAADGHEPHATKRARLEEPAFGDENAGPGSWRCEAPGWQAGARATAADVTASAASAPAQWPSGDALCDNGEYETDGYGLLLSRFT